MKRELWELALALLPACDFDLVKAYGRARVEHARLAEALTGDGVPIPGTDQVIKRTTHDLPRSKLVTG